MLVFKLRYYSSAILREFDTRFHFLKQGLTAIELGSNKGDWTKYISSKINSETSSNLFAIGDSNSTDFISGINYINGDIQSPKTLITLQRELKLNPVDLIISNLQPQSQNDRDLDNFAQIELNKQVLHIALKTLKTGGVMLMRAREGEPEKLFSKYLRLYFKDFYKITPTVETIASNCHYYLGSGFKMREELQKYQSFFHKIQNNQEEHLLEEEIPPTYQTAADRDLEVLEFLDFVSTHQIAITQEYVDSVKQHPRFKTLNWDKYLLNIVPSPLTEFQEGQVFYAKYAGRLSFSPDFLGIDERMAKADVQMQKYDQVMTEKDTSKSLLDDNEVLGQNPNDFDEEFQKLKKEFLKLQQSVKDGTFMPDDIDATEREGAQNFLDTEGLKYVKTNYSNKQMKDVIQGEIDKGIITKEELNDFFDLDDQQLMDKVNDDYNQLLTRQNEKKTQNLGKEHRTPYYERKKKLKNRRQ